MLEEHARCSQLSASSSGLGKREEVYTLKHQAVQKVQEAFVRNAVTELNAFDNVYFEICNEPYFGGVTLDWQARIAAVITDTEKTLPHKHLIAQNIANEKAKIERPDPAVSIFNFHYATPPLTVGMNFGLNKPIADDETGFRGIHDQPYRIEAWDFVIAGGAIFDHLDARLASGPLPRRLAQSAHRQDRHVAKARKPRTTSRDRFT